MSLLLVSVAALVFLLLLIAVLKLHPFLALLLMAFFTGICSQLPLQKIISSITTGMGNTLGPVVAVLALGVLLGSLLTESGAAQCISSRLVHALGPRHIKTAVLLTALVTGIALFYNAGFVVLLPLVLALAKESNLPPHYLALAMASALSVTHGFLPPHPGPVAVAAVFGAATGKTLLYGLTVAIPAVVVAGWWWPEKIKSLPVQTPAGLAPLAEPAYRFSSFTVSLVLALLPVLLMAGGVVVGALTPATAPIFKAAAFIADPLVALTITVVVALLFFSKGKRQRLAHFSATGAAALQAVTSIILIIGAGGAFKQILLDTGTAQTIAGFFAQTSLSPLLLGWLVATIIRIAIGSATVAAITAAGIVQPLLASSGASPELMVIAIGAGSLMCSHVNDTGFWMFKEYLGLSLKDTFRSWTVMETLVGTIGLIGVLLLQQIV